MGAGPKLIGFPLFVMFMVTLVTLNLAIQRGEGSTRFTGTSGELFVGTRELTDFQAELFDNFVQSGYDNYGENPEYTRNGGDWSGQEQYFFIRDLTILQDSEFPEYESGEETGGGHYLIGKTLLQFMIDLYKENAIRVDENDVRYYIGIDPQSMLEWEELNASNFNLSDTLVFIGIFFGVIILVGIVGIRIFGSGLAETSINFIVKITMFLLLWGLLSITAGGYLNNIPVFGIIIWITLTFVYMMGVFLTLSGAGEE